MTQSLEPMTAEAIHDHIVATWPDTVAARTDSATFYSCDPSNWPNFATLVTTDEYDQFSDLSRPGVFRLNIGIGPKAFKARFATDEEHDFTALDRLMPHPVYGRQRWVCILNPSREKFEQVVVPLLAEAHDIVSRRWAAQRTG
jgi:hypothetical protein